MASTSQKHRNFVAEPMGDKGVDEVAGIGPVYGGRLRDLGFDKAYVLLGQFLVLKKNEALFADWLKLSVGMSSRYAKVTSKCLQEWSFSFI